MATLAGSLPPRKPTQLPHPDLRNDRLEALRIKHSDQLLDDALAAFQSDKAASVFTRMINVSQSDPTGDFREALLPWLHDNPTPQQRDDEELLTDGYIAWRAQFKHKVQEYAGPLTPFHSDHMLSQWPSPPLQRFIKEYPPPTVEHHRFRGADLKKLRDESARERFFTQIASRTEWLTLALRSSSTSAWARSSSTDGAESVVSRR